MTARARAAGKELDALQAWLSGRGIDVRRYAGGMKYHAKYLVADGRLALVTTANLTARCFDRTCDFTLVTRDPAVVVGPAASSSTPTGTAGRVDGQKVWSSYAARADFGLLLARTDPDAAKPQAGITMFVLPMDAAG